MIVNVLMISFYVKHFVSCKRKYNNALQTVTVNKQCKVISEVD